MAGEKQNEGPAFLMNLGMQLGELRANQETLLGRIEAIEEMLGGGAQAQPGAQPAHHAQPQAIEPKASTPLDTFSQFTGETGKLMKGISELHQMFTTYGPMLQALKASVTPAPATQPAQPAATAPAAQTPQPRPSVFEPAPAGHA